MRCLPTLLVVGLLGSTCASSDEMRTFTADEMVKELEKDLKGTAQRYIEKKFRITGEVKDIRKAAAFQKTPAHHIIDLKTGGRFRITLFVEKITGDPDRQAPLRAIAIGKVQAFADNTLMIKCEQVKFENK